MAQVTCRCGELIGIEPGDPERIVCPRCGANIRLRRRDKSRPSAPLSGASETADGFLRFLCPCGRRLKVRAADRPEAGRCPDCNRVVPVPESAWSGGPMAGVGPGVAAGSFSGRGGSNARTADLGPDEVAQLNEWATRHQNSPKPSDRGPTVAGRHNTSVAKFEAGLRVCPKCGRPVHMGADACRECGTVVPRGSRQ